MRGPQRRENCTGTARKTEAVNSSLSSLRRSFTRSFRSTEAISTASLMDVPVYRRAGFVPSPPSASTRHRLPLPVCFVVRCLLSKQRCLSLQRQWMDLTRASLLYSSPNRVAKDAGSCLLIFLLRLSLSKNIDSGSHVESLDRIRENADYQRENGYG